MQKAGIAGATGYIGYELITLIHRHPELEVGWLTSERNAGKRFNQVFSTPWAYPLISLADAYLRPDEVDVVFLCLPHAKSMEAVKRFYAAGVRVIDLSADFRLKDVDVYKRWYGVEHTAPELCVEARYGLCELYRSQLGGAQLIANPGCYPTSVNLGLYPLAKAGWLGERVIIDSKSGVSGAGRKTNLTYQFVEANEKHNAIQRRPSSPAHRRNGTGAGRGQRRAARPQDSFHAPSSAGQPGHPEHDVRGRARRRDRGAYPRALRGRTTLVSHSSICCHPTSRPAWPTRSAQIAAPSASHRRTRCCRTGVSMSSPPRSTI